MTDVVVRVERLGKQYRIGVAQQRVQYETIRDRFVELAAAPIRRWRAGRASDPDATIWALRDVSLDVPAGQVLGIIGRNGAGKSTLLKILSRITRPTEGHAEMRGRVGSLLEVGTGFHPELTGRDNIFLNGALLGMRRRDIERRFAEIVEFSGVARFLDTPVKRYSSGMYVRLAFAVAAHLEPEVLIVDEVLAVGDAEFQRKCLGRMQAVVHEGRTVLFVSHNMAAVKSLCHRVVLLEAGRVVADGSTDEAIDRYIGSGRGQNNSGVIPIQARRSGTGEARFVGVELRNLNDQPIHEVYFGEPFRVVMDLNVMWRVTDVVLSVGVSSIEGARIVSAYSTDGRQPLRSFSPGLHRVAVDVDVTLMPRSFTLDLLVTPLDGREIDAVNQVLDFTALGVAQSGADGYGWSTVHAYVRAQSTWHAPQAITSGALPAASPMTK
jgi:lipopolysaccharide transport system ATP-binding protein